MQPGFAKGRSLNSKLNVKMTQLSGVASKPLQLRVPQTGLILLGDFCDFLEKKRVNAIRSFLEPFERTTVHSKKSKVISKN